jgi:hypothetical protein
MNTIREQWEIFNKLVMPKDAPHIQIREMRRSFYAGAEAMLRIQSAMVDYSDDIAVAMLQGLHDEIELFAAEMLRGAA